MRVSRRFIALSVAALCLAGMLSVTDAAVAPRADAATGASFNAANIISDAVFYNQRAMSAAQIQAFLNAKVPTCRAGYTCLKSYKQTTTTRAADSRCAAYSGAANETAATILYKVAQACAINPQVLLVTLQKEESLVTDDWPGTAQYRIAMGYGCPDSSGCDSAYYGFFNQVYSAAHQFQVYRASPQSFRHVAGRAVSIAYNPNPACGSKTVTIANQATAGLYNYTPYTPNAAALSNLYGVGDSCSAYGNRNFWAFFTDWFGSTQAYAVASQLVALWTASGQSAGTLGAATSAISKYSDGGVGQTFQHGWAYWGPATGAFMTSGAVGASYVALLGPTGVLGYPTAGQRSEPSNAVSQAFQKGSLYTTPAGKIHRVASVIRTAYLAAGGPAGVLGFPTDSTLAAPRSGQYEPFDHGRIYWSSATGSIALPAIVLAAYDAAGGAGGKLGYPIVAQKADSTGTSRIEFENGTISWSSTSAPAVTMRPAPTVARLWGADRYSTAIAISRAAFPGTAAVVYVATGQNFADALAAAPAAAKQGAPLLLTTTRTIPAAVLSEISRLKPAKIVVVGGTGAVSDAVATRLKAIAPITRIGGSDRYDTAAKIIRYAFANAKNVYLATGLDYPDALSGAAAAGVDGSAVLLVNGRASTLSAAAKAAITALHPAHVYVLGGTTVVSSGIQSAVAKLTPTTRIYGNDRYATSALVGGGVAPQATEAFVATGTAYPDALSGAVLSARRLAPLYLVKATCIPAQTWLNMTKTGVRKITILGGSGAVGAGVTALHRCG